MSVTLDNAPLAAQADGSFESSALPDGQHTLKYAIGSVKQAPVFDYLTVTAGPSTPINGRTLIVDDSELTYKGSWSTNPPHALKYDYSTSLYRDTAHWSSTVGDTIEFQFTGTPFDPKSLLNMHPNILSRGMHRHLRGRVWSGG